MSYFTKPFENKKIHIASSICAFVNGKHNTLIVTSGERESIFNGIEDVILLYTPAMDFEIQVSKAELLKAIQQTPVMGEIDD